MKTAIQLRTVIPPLLIILTLACFGLLPQTQAVVPAPDGGYPGGNTAEGQNALLSLTTGVHNTAMGYLSLKGETTGGYNTAVGSGTLLANTADGNTATGAFALLANTTGTGNTATGAVALLSNTGGNNNTANGLSALQSNTTGDNNTANGARALSSNNIGFLNTAAGASALRNNTMGNNNTANGAFALLANTDGISNTAIGAGALQANTSGSNNTAVGFGTFFNMTTGDFNTVLGADAGNNVTTADNVICIGALVTGANVNNSCYIGNIFGQTFAVGNAGQVWVDSNNKLGTLPSSWRFKRAIKPMDKASEAILALKPVTFHYKSDVNDTPQFGLIAEEVAKVNPALVLSDKEGKPYTVRYDAVNAMLLNEFLKEHKAFVEEHRKVQKLEVALQAVNERLKEQEAKIQKVKDQVEMNRNGIQVVQIP